MKKIKTVLLAVLVIVIILAIVCFMAKLDHINYTEEELQDLYLKYNITENDIKFAKNELPHYLEGTILNGDKRVIATETGEPPEGLKEGDHYDIIISIEEMGAITDEARKRYIKKYGVDPSNPKIDEVNGIYLPKEVVNRLVKYRKLDLAHAEPLEYNVP